MADQLPLGEAATAAAWSSGGTAGDAAAPVMAFVAHAKAAAADGLTLAEFSELLVALVRTAMQVVNVFPVEGQAKKAFVVSSAPWSITLSTSEGPRIAAVTWMPPVPQP